jgi:surface polysaccharide O-acyltransferase-like enzyme
MLIVCAHALPSFDWSADPMLERLIDGIANESSIFFFFIAGYLFQHLSGRFHYGHYLRQKAKTVIAPYLILSIPALLIFTVFAQRTGMWSWFYELSIWQQMGLFLLTGKHLAPLWFVPTITLFYLAAPLFIKLDRRAPQFYWLILPLWLLSIYLGRNGPIGPVEKGIYLLPVYMLGMVLSHFQVQGIALVARAWVPLLLVSLFGFVGEVAAWPQPPFYFMIMKAPMALLMTVALLKWHTVFGRRLDYIAHISFGIFFIHAYFISALKVAFTYLLVRRWYAGDGSSVIPGTLLNFLAFSAVVLFLSVVTIWAGQRLLGKHSRMIIGA